MRGRPDTYTRTAHDIHHKRRISYVLCTFGIESEIHKLRNTTSTIVRLPFSRARERHKYGNNVELV